MNTGIQEYQEHIIRTPSARCEGNASYFQVYDCASAPCCVCANVVVIPNVGVIVNVVVDCGPIGGDIIGKYMRFGCGCGGDIIGKDIPTITSTECSLQRREWKCVIRTTERKSSACGLTC